MPNASPARRANFHMLTFAGKGLACLKQVASRRKTARPSAARFSHRPFQRGKWLVVPPFARSPWYLSLSFHTSLVYARRVSAARTFA